MDNEQFPPSQAGTYGLYVITDGLLRDKPQGLSIEDDVNSSVGLGKEDHRGDRPTSNANFLRIYLYLPIFVFVLK